jgi:heme A synthase
MKITQTVVALTLMIGLAVSFVSPVIYAAKCGTTETSIIGCDPTIDDSGPIEKSGIWGILLLAINILSAGVVLAGVCGVAYGAIMYTTAGGSSDRTRKARMIIFNTTLGIIFYVLLYAIIQYLIPGGVFK